MPKIPPSILARFGRGFRATGAAIRPVVPFALGTSALALGAGFVVKEATGFRAASNPPLQKEVFDTDPTKPGDETQIAFDPKTGRTLVFGQPSSEKVGPERSQEREISTLLIVAGAVAAVGLVVYLSRGGK